MNELVLADKPEEFDRSLLYERAASRYLDLLDEEGRHPRLERIAKLILEQHPFYDAEQVILSLKSSEFDQYLQTRRRDHLLQRTAAKLLAAETGARIGVSSLQELMDRLSDPECKARMKTKDLIALAKLGLDLNAEIDKDLTEVTGDGKVTIEMKNVLIGLPPDRAAAVLAEYARSITSPKAKAEIEDGDSNSK